MSVIGYIRQCDLCNAKMIVTVEAKDMKFCPECLDEFIQDAIGDAIEAQAEADVDGDHLPPGQVIG